MTESKSPPHRHAARWILLAVLLAMGSCTYYIRYHTGQNAMRFDRDRWLAFERDKEGNSTRWNMVGDLLRRHQLVGMTRGEVEALLGRASDEARNDVYPYPGWDLGQFPGRSHTTALCLEFGPDGRVVKVWNPGR